MRSFGATTNRRECFFDMAGDWIKIEHATPDKPEIVKMSGILDMDQDAVTGKLIRLWIWADQNSEMGNGVTVTDSFIDRVTFCSGFSAALRNVGWLTGKNGCLTLPNFDRHNGQTAKDRANINRRVAKHRKKNNALPVTDVTLEPLQKPLPEKRREEKNNTTYLNACAEEINQFPSSVEEVEHYMKNQHVRPQDESELRKCAESFLDELQAVGWKNKQGIPLADWKPLARKSARIWFETSFNNRKSYPTKQSNVRMDNKGINIKPE